MAGTRRAAAAPQATTAVQPGVAELRVIGPPAVVDAACGMLEEALGAAWQPGTRKKSRHGDAQELLYGTLIVAMSTDPEASAPDLLAAGPDGDAAHAGKPGVTPAT